MSTPVTFVNKLVHSYDDDADTKHYIYLRSEWNNYEITLLLHDSRSCKCYKAKATEGDFKEAATDFGISPQLFYDECRAALTTNMSLPGFKYLIKDGAFQLIKCNEHEVKYLDLTLQETKNQSELLDTAFNLLAEKKKLSEAECEATSRKLRDYEELSEIYEQCLQEKYELKKDLIRRFAIILNEKKIKIKALQEQLQGGSEEEIDDGVRRKSAKVRHLDSTDEEDFAAPTQKIQLQE